MREKLILTSGDKLSLCMVGFRSAGTGEMGCIFLTGKRRTNHRLPYEVVCGVVCGLYTGYSDTGYSDTAAHLERSRGSRVSWPVYEAHANKLTSHDQTDDFSSIHFARYGKGPPF